MQGYAPLLACYAPIRKHKKITTRPKACHFHLKPFKILVVNHGNLVLGQNDFFHLLLPILSDVIFGIDPKFNG